MILLMIKYTDSDDHTLYSDTACMYVCMYVLSPHILIHIIKEDL